MWYLLHSYIMRLYALFLQYLPFILSYYKKILISFNSFQSYKDIAASFPLAHHRACPVSVLANNRGGIYDSSQKCLAWQGFKLKAMFLVPSSPRDRVKCCEYMSMSSHNWKYLSYIWSYLGINWPYMNLSFLKNVFFKKKNPWLF